MTKPIIYILVKICYKLLYVRMSFKELKVALMKYVRNSLALSDIKVFGHTYMYTCFCGLTHFSPQVFCLAYHKTNVTNLWNKYT